MDTGRSFDLVFVTADRKRGTGGKLKLVKGYRKIMGTEPSYNLPSRSRIVQTTSKRNPDHAGNKTFNIYNPANPGEHAVKVHWRLITFFNNKRVIQ